MVLSSYLSRIMGKVIAIGEFQLFLLKIFVYILKPPYRRSLLFNQLNFIGTQSLGIIIMTGFFTGAVFGLQIGGIFSVFKAEDLMGGATGIALATELAPLVSGFLLAGRVGSAITAEISTMVVNEQVDAMEAMGVDPVEYLFVPRILASMIIMPLLCGIFMFMGVVGCYLVGVFIFSIDPGIFFEKLIALVQTSDIMTGLRKMFVFAFIISLFSCQYGITASGGAKGVGDATTSSVVRILIVILFTDFLISYFEVKWLS